MSTSSYRTILRSSSIIGGAQVINIASSLVKMKAAALLLGPPGVGLAGLYMNLVQTAASVAALGLGNSGTRQIAAAQASGSDVALAEVRRALFWGTIGLALVGAAAFWISSGWIARFVLDEAGRSGDVAWLSFGVAFTVMAGSQAALLTGMRRVGDLARVSVGTGILGTSVGLAALWLQGTQGIVTMVLVVPIITFLLGHFYVAKLGPPPLSGIRPRITRELRTMMQLGFAFMVSGLITLIGHLAARTLVQRELGPAPLGQFQASWSIGMTYLGFVLNAMGTDYFPRLTVAIKDRATAARLVNEQTEVALLLCAPVILLMLGLAPWVIRLLYSADFGPAIEVLRWQLLGDILKVMSWPLGFVLLADGAGRLFMLTDAIGIGVFLLGIWIGLPLIGVKATGVAFLAFYSVYLPLVWWLSRRRLGFRWTKTVLLSSTGIMAAAVSVNLLSLWSDLLASIAGVTFAASAGVAALLRLRMVIAPGRMFKRATE